MPGNAQPLVNSVKIVNDDGTPTDYFIRWAQERQIDITAGITAAQAQQIVDDWALARDIVAGTALNGGGNLSADVTIDHADSAVTPNTYGDATHVAQITVDQQGHVTDVQEVAISGGGGGGAWYFSPPTAASFTLQSGDATNLTLGDDADVGLTVLGGTPVNGDIQRMAYRTLTTPSLDWSMVVRMNWAVDPSNYTNIGLHLHDSVGGRTLSWVMKGSGANALSRIRWNGLGGGFSSENNADLRGYWNWLRIDRVGANLLHYWSADGKVWHLQMTETVTAWLANAPNRVGIVVVYNRTNQTSEYSVDYFSLTGPAV